MDDASLDHELGPRLNWSPVQRPDRRPLQGRYVTLEPMDAARHADALFEAAEGEGSDPLLWRYLPYGPFGDLESFRSLIEKNSASDDPLYFTVIPEGGTPAGQATFMRMDPANGVIEIGHI